MSLRSLIRNWLLNESVPSPKDIQKRAVIARADDQLEGANASMRRFEIIDAINGRIIKMGVYKPNPHGPDWAFMLYVLNRDESVADAINTLMVLKGD